MRVATFYRFHPLDEGALEPLRERLLAFDLKGLVLLATEGVNATVAGEPDEVDRMLRELQSLPGFGELDVKDSRAEEPPFRRWKVEIRSCLIAGEARPAGLRNHLSPREWHRTLLEEEVVVVDTRNRYETLVGTFEGALDPGLEQFSDFPEFVRRAELPRDKKLLLYCTGGIRCEKAVLEMERQGYSQVYQLEGGILRYLEQFPQGKFRGECFVFDERVALDAHLEPSSRYRFCPHCGDPGDRRIECEACGRAAVVCRNCGAFCSRGCARR